MAKPPKNPADQSPARPEQSEREARLAAALRANLRRRKAQSRARTESEAAVNPSPPTPPSGQD